MDERKYTYDSEDDQGNKPNKCDRHSSNLASLSRSSNLLLVCMYVAKMTRLRSKYSSLTILYDSEQMELELKILLRILNCTIICFSLR